MLDSRPSRHLAPTAMMECLNNNTNAIQAIAAVAIACLTGVLVWATLRYARAADKSLQLSKEQLDREWRPHLHVEVRKTKEGDAMMFVTNLAKPSVLVKTLRIRIDETGQYPATIHPLNIPLLGGHGDKKNIARDLVEELQFRGLVPTILQPSHQWRGAMSVSLVFESAGTYPETKWVGFVVTVRHNAIAELDPIRDVLATADPGK